MGFLTEPEVLPGEGIYFGYDRTRPVFLKQGLWIPIEIMNNEENNDIVKLLKKH